MLTNDKIKQRTLVFLILLEIFVLIVVVFFLSNNAFAQTLHDKTIYNIVNPNLDSEINSRIDVGAAPTSIAIYNMTDTIYVANFGSDSVSVISGKNNTKLKDIPVGYVPLSVAINEAVLLS